MRKGRQLPGKFAVHWHHGIPAFIPQSHQQLCFHGNLRPADQDGMPEVQEADCVVRIHNATLAPEVNRRGGRVLRPELRGMGE